MERRTGAGPSAHGHLRHYLPVIATAVIGLACAGAALQLGSTWEAERERTQFDKVASERRQDLQRTVNASLEVLHSLASFFRGSRLVERAEFRTFVEDGLARHPEIYSLQWRPRVPAAERADLEARVRAGGFPDFEIRDATLAGRLVRAGARPEYFPLLYAEPIEPSRAILGLDRSNEPERRKLLEWSLRRAARLATPVASGPVRLYQFASDPRDPYAILVNVPVYRGAVTPPRKAERMGELAGFVVAIFRVGGLVEAGLRGEPEAGFDLAVLDDAPAAARDPLYYHHSRAPGARALAPEDWDAPAGLCWTGAVRLANRGLSLVYLENAARARRSIALAWPGAAVILVLFAVTSGFLWTSLRSHRQIQALAGGLRAGEARLQRQNLALSELASERVIRYQRLGEAMRVLTERVAHTLEVARVGVWRFTEAETRIECLHLYEREGDRHGTGGVLTMAECPAYLAALREGRVLAVDDARNDPRTRELAAGYLVPLGVGSMLDAPVRLGDRLVGVVCHEHVGPKRQWTVDEQGFAGSVADLVSLALEVWQHDQARVALARSEERYRSLVTAITHIAGVLSGAGELMERSPSWEAFTGQSEQEARGGGYLAAIHPEDRARVVAQHGEIGVRAPALAETEFRVRRHDGVYRLLHYRAAPVRGADGLVWEWMVAGTDVTEVREAERALADAHLALEARVAARTRELAAANERLTELDRLKSEFLATMSHELRTPLNSIIGFTGILRQGIAGPVNTEQHKQLTMVYASAKHLLGLINDLLDVSRIESGRMEVATTLVWLPEVVAEVLQVLGPLAAQRRIAITAEPTEGLPEIETDRKKLFQILLNLATNAVKFTEHGGVSITARTTGELVEVSVTDTGIGIKPENMALLFEAFRQIEGSSERRYEGAGLGLHLSLRLARMLGGDIRAESRYGQGSRFTLQLPIAGPGGHETAEGPGRSA